MLLDSSQLLALDQLMDKHVERLRVEGENILSEKVDARVQSTNSKKNLTPDELEKEIKSQRQSLIYMEDWTKEDRVLTMGLSRGRELKVQNFAEAIEHAELDEEIPFRFSYYYKTGKLKINIGLNSGWSEEGLTVETAPNDLETMQSIFGSLSNWANEASAPIWQQMWFSCRSVIRFILWMSFVFGLVSLAGIYYSTPDTQAANKAEAHKLLQHGIDASNESRAVALLLAIESGFDTGVHDEKPRRIPWGYPALILGILACLSICPESGIIVAWKILRFNLSVVDEVCARYSATFCIGSICSSMVHPLAS
jgi:hypothetical protein